MNRCDDCNKKWTDEQLEEHNKLGVENIPDLEQRIDPGCEVPSGECPACGALVYVVKKRQITITVNEKNARKMLTEWHVDEITDRKMARYYANDLIDRMRKDCAV